MECGIVVGPVPIYQSDHILVRPAGIDGLDLPPVAELFLQSHQPLVHIGLPIVLHRPCLIENHFSVFSEEPLLGHQIPFLLREGGSRVGERGPRVVPIFLIGEDIRPENPVIHLGDHILVVPSPVALGHEGPVPEEAHGNPHPGIEALIFNGQETLPIRGGDPPLPPAPPNPRRQNNPGTE